MRIELGATVWTRDGQRVGTVDRLIFDPDRGQVKAAVVRKGAFLPRDVEVPLDQLTVDEQGHARLAYTRDEVDALPEFFEGSYTTTPPSGYTAPLAYPAAGLYWPTPLGLGHAMGVPFPAGTGPLVDAGGDPEVRAEAAEALRRQDLENAVVGEGSAIKSRDGQTVGELDRLVFDADSGEVVGFVVRRGFIFTKTIQLPASLIDGADDGVLHLNATADELRA
jgi:uncharacterized protein YrrD